MTQAQIKIKKAFLELYYLYGYEGVTVKMIIDKAKVNRATFYLYYYGIAELLDKIEEEASLKIDEINQNNRVHYYSDDVSEASEFFIPVSTYMYENKETFKALLSSKARNNFKDDLSNKMFRNVSYRYSSLENANNEHNKIVLSYLISGSIGAISQWISSENPCSATEFSNIISSINLKGFFMTIKE